MTSFFDNPHKNLVLYEFKRTPPISSYLFFLCAGPFKMYESEKDEVLKQRVYARYNLVHTKPKLMMDIVGKTIQYYEKTFNFRFPFSKLDHVVCPDFKYGGWKMLDALPTQKIKCVLKQT